jgi:nitronate monooxygenase/enoyl-[acyl-carrier protein] reductase II
VLAALQQGRIHELLPFAGESAGLVQDIVPAGEIVQRLVAEARQALERSQTLLTEPGTESRARKS